ncbi:lipopolysaccharide biosynthesis protein [Parabacteroides faecis]|uniref:O-antigen/teichoic acid export membrane protein n=1 Tax=Parabacteroides faecis TaxID=1217282 RepID=A0ABR6KNF0_9BACT|nr:lipopolysaccharide biosynthesis protein [Parabacteroides faecis]MBB4622348.1 O-antigen/teichoic acid export membrane protein [Parabacteroides faecis]GGK11184.1 lipopolysaccharide biosynthesis protein [Parabacteroides faecis]
MSDSLKHQAVKGVIWSAIERFSVQGIQFVLTIIIARLVLPADYGLIAMLNIFLAIAQVFVDSGFSNALIQKKDRTETDFSTVFYFNIFISVVFYLLLYFSAPYISSFYKEPSLSLITRWIGLNIIISGLSIVQRAKLTINVDFKKQAKVSFTAVLVSGIIGIILAYKGWGVWALVIQTLSSSLLNTLLLWIFAKWIPKWVFSRESFYILFSFGSKLLLSGLLHTIYMNLYSLVIGRRYSSVDVGFYNRAYQFANFPSINIVGIINRVIFPIQCEMQDDSERLRISFINYLRMSCFIIFPLMIIAAVLSKPLILLLLTDKWLPAAKLLSILCFAYMWYPVMVVNNQILNVKGHSDYFLRAEILKKIIAITILFVTLSFGVQILCWGIVIYNFFDMIIIIYYSKKVIYVKYSEQVRYIMPLFLISLLTGGTVYLSTCFFDGDLLGQLIIGSLIGLLVYILACFIFRMQEIDQIVLIIKKLYIECTK